MESVPTDPLPTDSPPTDSLPTHSLPIEPDADERAAVERAVSAFITRFLDERDDTPVFHGPADPALVEHLLLPPNESGIAVEALLDRIGRAVDTGFDTASGGFLSYIPSGGLFSASLGTYLGSVLNRYTAGSHAAPGMVAIEESVIRWMASLFDLGEDAGGVLMSGGSLANLTAIVAARSRLGERFDGRFRDGVVYTSERTHHSITKGTRIAGVDQDRVRLIPTDARLRMNPDALAAAIASDVAAGLRPMAIAATAGTTDTGAIDPLDHCAELAAAHDAWFHVDAAYGGFFQLTDRGRARLAGIERADSITVDAHKSLFLPFGVGGLLVRNVAHLVDAHEGRGAYMQDVVDGDLPHCLAMGPELTRPNRGLPLWLALNLHGVDAFRRTLDSMLDLTARATSALRGMPGIELITEPELSIVAFRSTAGDTETARIQQVLNDSGRIHVSSTTIRDRLWIRFAFLSQRTTAAVVDDAIELVAGAITA